MAVVFDGKKFAAGRELMLVDKIKQLGWQPRMVSIFFAEDESSVLYTELKQKTALRVGIDFHPEKVSIKGPLEKLIAIVRMYSQNREFQGVMVQKPVQENVGDVEEVGELGFEDWWRRIVEEININKDIDCLHPVNLEKVYRGKWKIVPATVGAVIETIEFALRTRTGLVNRKVTIVGKSETVGKPLAYVLAQKGAKVYLCGSGGLAAESIGSQLDFTVEPMDLSDVVKEADIVVSATGKAGLIRGEMVKKDALVIDVGWPMGDVNFESVKKKASFITPVPGGVGPVTVVSLLENLLTIQR